MRLSKDEAIKILSRYDNEHYTPATRQAHRMGAEALKNAVEVVHGQWLDKTEVKVKPPFPPMEMPRVDCSVCGHIFWHTSALTYNYCPACGAKMDGDGNA